MREVRLPGGEALLLQLVPSTGQAGMGSGRVVVVFLSDGPNLSELVHVLSQQRKVLGNVDSRGIRGNRKELAAVLDRPVRLQIPRVLMGWPTPHKEQDYAFCSPENRAGFSPSKSSLGLPREQSRQRQTQRSQRPGLQRRPPIHAIAEADGTVCLKIEHGVKPRTTIQRRPLHLYSAPQGRDPERGSFI